MKFTIYFLIACSLFIMTPPLWAAKNLTCKHMPDLKLYFPAQVTGAYCQNADVRCKLLQELENLKASNKLNKEFIPELKQKLHYDLKECAAAVLLQDPDYLKRL